jgi:hypothetical protein
MIDGIRLKTLIDRAAPARGRHSQKRGLEAAGAPSVETEVAYSAGRVQFSLIRRGRSCTQSSLLTPPG